MTDAAAPADPAPAPVAAPAPAPAPVAAAPAPAKAAPAGPSRRDAVREARLDAQARQALEEARGRAAALEAKLAALEPEAKAWRAEKVKQEDQVRGRFGNLPEDTRKRLGSEPSITEMRAFLAAFDSSEAGVSDAAPRGPAPMMGPPGAKSPAPDPFQMSDSERREWLSDPARVNAYLVSQGVNDRAHQRDPFGRPIK